MIDPKLHVGRISCEYVSILFLTWIELLFVDLLCMALITVNTIGLAKPEKAKMVESMLIQMAQTGQIQGKVTEQFTVSLLYDNLLCTMS